MERTCTECGNHFTVSGAESALLTKLTPVFGGKEYPIPPPALCFECRLQRRLAFYNGRTLYRRTCGLTGKEIISIYSPESRMKVYERDEWYKDSWDPMEYGREFDFSRPFFPQFRELMEAVPMPSRAVLGFNQNSDYTNDNWKLKNCYMVFDGEQSEDCYHGQTFEFLKNCTDFLVLSHSELCYECVNCATCYALRHSRFCVNCSESWFLRDCIGCRDCFGCANLRQKQYCVWNKQKTKEEYEAFLREFRPGSHSAVAAMKRRSEEFFAGQPVKATRGEQNIDCTGDNLHQSKNSYGCFDAAGMHDCMHMTNCLMGARDSGDIHIWGLGMELCYNGVVIGSSPQRVMCCYYATEGVSNVYYSTFCSRNASNLFGCIGLRHKQDCILNRQYSREEFGSLAGRIAEHMQRTGEWGAYFPPEISMFGYNETAAQTLYPLAEEGAHARGWQWSGFQPKVEAARTIPASQLPDDTASVPDEILEWAILCEATGKPFKLVKQELQFYRSQKLPIPRRHPDRRHEDRFALKNPFRFFERACGTCGTAIQTTYAPERPEKVLCEECYRKEVY